MAKPTMPQNLRRSLALSVLLPSVSALLLALVFLWQIRHLLELSRWVAHTEQVISETTEAQKLVVDMETGMRGYLIRGDRLFLEPYTLADSKLPSQLERTGALLADNPPQLARLRKIEALFGQWRAFARESVKTGPSAGANQGVELTRAREAKSLMDEIRRQVDDIIHTETSLRDTRRREVESATHFTLRAGLALALIWGLVMSLLSVRQIRAVAHGYENTQRELRRSHDELELRVQERTVALTAANAELEAFCYSVSHDLRSPLRGIDGFSQALLDDYGPKLDAQAVQYLTYVREGVQRMGRIIDDLLSLSRLTRLEVSTQDVDLSGLGKEVLARLRQQDPARKVDAHIQDGMHARGDSGLLSAVLENLLSNAWKFTSKKAAAHIDFGVTDLSHVPPPPASLGVTVPERAPVYYVKDDGAGFDMAYVDKLFGAFQRLHSAQEYQGTGVGLATVRRILRKHGGDIWVQARPDQGAAFYFTLPLV